MAYSNYGYPYPAYQGQPQMNSYPYTGQTMQPQQIQNGGFISVGSEAEARSYPIAPGNSITFKDDNQPYVYVKTMGFNQLDMPKFKKYKLIEEVEQAAAPQTNFVVKEDFEVLAEKLERLKKAFLAYTDKETLDD